MALLNIVYPPHKGEPVVLYKGEEGTVWLSCQKNKFMQNVYTSRYCCPKPTYKDFFIQLEPVVVNPLDYDIKYLKRFGKIFGCFNKVFEKTSISHKYIPVNYGSILSYKNPEELRKQWLDWKSRRHGVIIVSAGKKSDHKASIYHLREEIADFLHENNFPVSWYGTLPSNKKKEYYKGRVEDKLQEIRKFRFHLCSENTYDAQFSHNYFTEKMRDSIYGGAVPLYIGCYNIDEFAPKESFFDLRKYVVNCKFEKKQDLLKDLLAYTETDFEKFQKSAYDYLSSEKGLMYQIDMKRYYKKILSLLNK